MIEKTSAFKTSDGTTHASLEDAQRHQLGLLLDLAAQIVGAQVTSEAKPSPQELSDAVIERILEKREGVIAILGAKTRKPRAKKNSTPAPRTRRTTVPSPGTESTQDIKLA